jgi:hypothetical protein
MARPVPILWASITGSHLDGPPGFPSLIEEGASDGERREAS